MDIGIMANKQDQEDALGSKRELGLKQVVMLWACGVRTS